MAKKARARRVLDSRARSALLKMMGCQKKRASHVAKRLKRTEGATRQKAFSMGDLAQTTRV